MSSKTLVLKNKREGSVENIGHFVNGAKTPGKSKNYSNVFNPATGEIQAKVALANSSELEAIVRGKSGLTQS